jgi:hypothetical protein
MNIIDIKGNLHDERILAVISLKMYMPTSEKLKSLAGKYELDSAVSAFACVDDGFVCGAIILKRTADNEFEIMCIAAAHNHRKKVSLPILSHTRRIS